MRLLVRTWNVFHGNTSPPRRRAFLDEMVRLASRDRPDVLAGDLNTTLERSEALRTLAAEESLSGATPTGIDHVLARGLRGSPGEPWPVERRVFAGRVLSDHSPVDRTLA